MPRILLEDVVHPVLKNLALIACFVESHHEKVIIDEWMELFIGMFAQEPLCEESFKLFCIIDRFHKLVVLFGIVVLTTLLIASPVFIRIHIVVNWVALHFNGLKTVDEGNISLIINFQLRFQRFVLFIEGREASIPLHLECFEGVLVKVDLIRTNGKGLRNFFSKQFVAIPGLHHHFDHPFFGLVAVPSKVVEDPLDVHCVSHAWL